MSYAASVFTSVEYCPHLGKRQVRVSDCRTCKGTGHDTWHLGCGDTRAPSCRTCDGCGQVAHARPIDPKTDKAYGPWVEYE